MRTLEIIIVLLSTLYFLYGLLGYMRKYPKIKFIPVILIAAIGLHLFWEGYRWQMIPSYLIAILFIGHSLIYQKGKEKRSKWVFTGWFMIGILQVVAILLPYGLPVIQFPNPPGPHIVGIKTLHLQDVERDEFLTPDSTDFREFMVRFYYPAKIKSGERAKYIPEFDDVVYAYEKKLGWPPELFSYLSLFEVHAFNDAEPLNSESFPLIIYSHGLSNNFTEASARLVNLASNGYVVAAINHTYSSDFSVFPDGRVKKFVSLSLLGDPIEKVDSTRTLRVNQWVNDFEFTIESLKENPEGIAIDFENIGLIGFSNGGSAATLASGSIENVKAAINLDGTPRGAIDSTAGDINYLFMTSERVHYSDQQLDAWGITREMVEGPVDLKENRMNEILTQKGGTLVHIPGTNHSNFIEYPLISPFSSLLEIGGSINSWKCYEMINELIYTTLDNALKAKNEPLPAFEEVEITTF